MKVLVTGGASGLGEAITKRLCSEPNGKVYFTFCKSKENAARIESDYPNAKGLACNFEIPTDVEQLLGKMDTMDLDVLINNAVTDLKTEHFQKMAHETFTSGFLYNIIPAIQITQKAIGIFRTKKRGKIVTILTAALHHKPSVGWSKYLAEKAYLAALCKSWVVENEKFNITSVSVSPSFMRTALTREMDERFFKRDTNYPAEASAAEILKPERVASFIHSLLSSQHLANGENFNVE